jgi:hypothetical protein
MTLHSETFQNAFVRWSALAGGLLCFWYCVSCYRRQSIHWRFPFYSDFKRTEYPVLYWFLVLLGLLLSFALMMGALFNVKKVNFGS